MSKAIPYSLTPEQIASITDVECAFSTERLLPSPEQIPKEFYSGNDYTRLVEAIFYGLSMPDSRIELKEGVEPDAFNRCIRAHLSSWGPRHEDKIAGVGYMVSMAATLHPTN